MSYRSRIQAASDTTLSRKGEKLPLFGEASEWRKDSRVTETRQVGRNAPVGLCGARKDVPIVLLKAA
jgi:hypothetical protein